MKVALHPSTLFIAPPPHPDELFLNVQLVNTGLLCLWLFMAPPPRSVALSLNMLDLLIIERYESTGRVADDVIDEIAAPLNDIITEAGTLIGYS